MVTPSSPFSFLDDFINRVGSRLQQLRRRHAAAEPLDLEPLRLEQPPVQLEQRRAH